MKILITSGGTSEKIDRVRSITNHSTGQLGKLIAETFLDRGHQVTLVTSPKALKPEPDARLKILTVENVADLLETLEPLVKEHDVLIHAMAVSDYSPSYMTGFSQLAQASKLEEFLTMKNQESKISSEEDFQVLFLKKTPKIISLVKTWNPKIRLVGFKLLVDVSKEELIQVARESLLKNQAEIIVANDLTTIDDQQHLAYLVDEKEENLAKTKQEIAQLLLERLSHSE
ncbi:phosphopantothenate--cysteine ligase [Streptococcus oricebi]|uniref:Phosphopantothenate--cysteine ligase n=1 Tax=Streptococcus oricebi TaxID=1547447 RepID=A0ABS5B353_9STRE|nr:phosphopantothenate--cysteine ligase [Streptococcus oricebi]MBP2623266.1 phosphopantothenate--cysteine ligase [Streptococcus oricebi]